MPPILSVKNLSKTYDGGFQALKSVSLDIERGEIIALLGPNGAGKTTLISAVCGIIDATEGTVTIDGLDHREDYRKVRKIVGLVPQEITLEPFEKVITTVRYSRGLFGSPRNDAFLDNLLARLSLADKKMQQIMTLSGGMKRRVLIAKALSHEPIVLFLDEPTAGVDVELRRDMWQLVRDLREQGVTIILTTHYIEEAEEIADRVAVINNGEILLVEEKQSLMNRLGQKQMTVELQSPIEDIPAALDEFKLQRGKEPNLLVYTYDTRGERTGITKLLRALAEQGLTLRDVQTHQSSLEEIFVSLVGNSA